MWRPKRQKQKWTDTVASVETNATDRSGLTLWQVWRPTRQRQKWTDTVASVETKATEAEGETETRPSSLSFQEAGPEVSTQLKGKTETMVNQNVECFTHAVPHTSSIRLDLNTLRLGLCQRLAALFLPRQCL